MSDIFSRLRSALVIQSAPTSDDLRIVIREARDALMRLQSGRRDFEATASNPLVDTPEAHRAQEGILRSHLDEKRLAEGLKLLEAKLGHVVEAETQAGLRAAYDAATTRRDGFLAKFRQAYAGHASAIGKLMIEMGEIDALVRAVTPPAGADRLDTCDTSLTLNTRTSFAKALRMPEALGCGCEGVGQEPKLLSQWSTEEVYRGYFT